MDKKKREISFNLGDFVYLKVSPIRGTRRFQVHGKLASRYIGPYQVLKKIGKVAYRLQLPEGMSDIYTLGVPCLTIKKVFEGIRDRTRASGGNRFAARPTIP